MSFDLDKYIATFNRGDDHATVEEFFTEDTIVEGPDRVMHGRREWAAMLAETHRDITEELKPTTVLHVGDHLMLEADATFTARKDRPDFLFGPVLKGESVTAHFFASYRLQGAQIARLALAWWPAYPARSEIAPKPSLRTDTKS